MSGTIIIVGTDRYGSLESSYARAFNQLGWTVRFWNPVTALHSVARGHRLGRLFSTFVNVEPWERKANLKLLQLVGELRPDIVLVIATQGVRSGTLAQAKVQQPRTMFYCLFPDTPHNLVPDRILCLPVFDRVMTVSPGWREPFVRLGARRVEVLPLAADPELHRPNEAAEPRADFNHDVAFVGNWRPEREAFLEKLVDFDLRLWGSSYWKRNTRHGSRLLSRYGGRPLFGEEFAQACAQHRIMLNIIDGVGYPGPNMRAFEQPACRGFSLVTRTPAMLELFTEGVNVECFDSVEEARDKIKFYLSHEDSRVRLAEESFNFVIGGGHTYRDRALQILQWAREDAAE